MTKNSLGYRKVKACVKEYLKDHPAKIEEEITIGCYGLTFKPDIDDLSGSPSLNIAKK